MARSWSIGIWSNPRVMVAVDCGEMDQADVREEIVVGYPCGGKPASYGSKAIVMSHGLGCVITITPLQLAHSAPDAMNYRVGPQPGAPLCASNDEQQTKIPGKGAL